MREMTWQQWLFVVCFAIFAVGGTWWIDSESLSGAVIALAVMTMVATGVWLGLVYVLRRALNGDLRPPARR